MAPAAPSSANGGVLTRLLLVNQHYYPDVASTGQHLTDLAEYLAQEGYLVEVLTHDKTTPVRLLELDQNGRGSITLPPASSG